VSRGTILVIDDDDDIRETMCLLLELEGWQVIGQRDGEEALAWVELHDPPSLILLDLRMPRMSGAELVQRLRREPSRRAIPIVLMSGDVTSPEVSRALGVTACLVKPFDLDALLAVVRNSAR
jgi:CheY-like chemotaxis protein